MRLPKRSGKKLADVISNLAEKLGSVFGKSEKEVVPKAEFGAKRVVSEASQGGFKRPPAELVKKSTMQKQNLSAKINTEMLGKAQDELLRLQKEYKDYVKANPRIEVMAFKPDAYQLASKGDKQKASRLQNLKELIKRAEKDVMDYQVKIINKEMAPGMTVDLEPRSKRMADDFEKTISGQKDFLSQMLDEMKKPAFQKQLEERKQDMFVTGNNLKLVLPRMSSEKIGGMVTRLENNPKPIQVSFPIMIDRTNHKTVQEMLFNFEMLIEEQLKAAEKTKEKGPIFDREGFSALERYRQDLLDFRDRVAQIGDKLNDAYELSLKVNKPVKLNLEDLKKKKQ